MKNIMCDYDEEYPNLVFEILDYFDIKKNSNNKLSKRTILTFLNKILKNGDYKYLNQDVVIRICERLCEKGLLQKIHTGGILGLNNIYASNSQGLSSGFLGGDERLKNVYMSAVYGFNYIYKKYKNVVLPLIGKKKNNNGGSSEYSVGTCFKFSDGIVTARHCLEDLDSAYIKGINSSELNKKDVYVSDNKYLDLAFIHTETKADNLFYIEEANVLDNILVMGYPKIPAFSDFLTVEKATISSCYNRICPTVGAVAAQAEQYLNRVTSLLITAKIRGGNSGGPVINENGCLVGIACQAPFYNNDTSDYDDLGYGIALPVKYLQNITEEHPCKLRLRKDFFIDENAF